MEDAFVLQNTRTYDKRFKHTNVNGGGGYRIRVKLGIARKLTGNTGVPKDGIR